MCNMISNILNIVILLSFLSGCVSSTPPKGGYVPENGFVRFDSIGKRSHYGERRIIIPPKHVTDRVVPETNLSVKWEYTTNPYFDYSGKYDDNLYKINPSDAIYVTNEIKKKRKYLQCIDHKVYMNFDEFHVAFCEFDKGDMHLGGFTHPFINCYTKPKPLSRDKEKQILDEISELCRLEVFGSIDANPIRSHEISKYLSGNRFEPKCKGIFCFDDQAEMWKKSSIEDKLGFGLAMTIIGVYVTANIVKYMHE